MTRPACLLLLLGLGLLCCDLTLPRAAAEEWVAVGYGGRRMISTDGLTWTVTAEWAENGGDDSNNLMSVAYGKGKYVAVGGGGFARDKQAGHILVSTDGRTWREVLKVANRVNPVVFDGSRFVAGGPDRTLLYSDDGETWQTGAQVAADGFPGWAMWFRHGAFGNGVYVFLGEGGRQKEFYWCVTSQDGTTADFRRDLPHLRGLAFGSGRFVAVGHGVIVTSSNGRDWEKQTRPDDEKLDWLVWTGREFLAGAGKQCLASPDGLSWQPRTLAPQGRVLWSDGTRFIASSWPGKMAFSADGKTWQRAPELPPNGINRVIRRDD